MEAKFIRDGSHMQGETLLSDFAFAWHWGPIYYFIYLDAMAAIMAESGGMVVDTI